MKRIRNVADAYSVFSRWHSERQEVVSSAFLNGGMKLLSVREIFRGTVNQSVANPREILRAALLEDAVYLIVAHNHPSQDPSPSLWDKTFTKRMSVAATAVGIPLLDHLIVCKAGRYFSFAESGQLKATRR
ncbi:MAG: JAB domain-containing protein [Bdellovibrionaceae bacterium]|nr:JAB domain-containing protein [Bdellovibrionales bacterium]MCB9253673.1 JAB domain-containing protein [Pseudobdellovibrionaceae bacterium]